MQTVHTIADLKAAVANARKQGKRIGFVPTMGNLHEGHITLVREAQKVSQFTVCSIFVNPTQFGANEDFGSYPRTLAADSEKLAAAGLDLIFAPSVDEMYPDNSQNLVQVIVAGISDLHCGASRPGHFVGVATVVTKLFNMVQPDVALFGLKDYQQVAVIRRMVKGLNTPVEIIGVPTVREANGLAMSSRNGYLTVEEKETAALLYKTLQNTAAELKSGNADFAKLSENANATLAAGGFTPDYYSIVRQEDLLPPAAGEKKLVILAAAKLGKARLIDNLEVNL
ncbi:MAG TPA: pantoate--beta-alanine ligase [Pseudomonadales bacterium]|nr:pantoate--beta-alanine ligase [Pseudomonadales bacterium]